MASEFDWSAIDERAKRSRQPSEPVEITGADVWTAVQQAARAGFAFGLLAGLLYLFLGDGPDWEKYGNYFRIVMGALVLVPVVWVPLALGAKMSSRSRGVLAGLIRLAYFFAVFFACIAGIIVVGAIVVMKLYIVANQR